MDFGRNSHRNTAFCVGVLLIMVFWFVPVCFAADAAEAGEAITQAELDLNVTYVQVAKADGAGADISGLLNALNSAGTYLSRANAAFNIGDYEGAKVLAMECSNTVAGVASEAANLGSYAQGVHDNMTFLAVFVAVFGVVFVIVFGFVGWRLLRRRYFRGILDKQPKVAVFCEL